MRNKKCWMKIRAILLAGVLAAGCGSMTWSAAAEELNEVAAEATAAEETSENSALEENTETAAAEGEDAGKEEQTAETEESSEKKESEITDRTFSGEEAGFEMSTPYPGVTAKAGNTVTFDLNFVSLSGSSYDLELKADAVPEGWNGYFSGSSNEISRIHIDSKSADATKAPAKYSLTIPEDVQEGTQTITLLAVPTSGGTAYALNLDVTIADTQNGEGTFTTEYPEQQAAAGTSFKFDGTIVNNRAVAQSYALSAKTEEGWQVSFTPSGESSQVASVSVDAGTSQGITVQVVPPETITKGEYTIPCTAVSADETLNLELKVVITGSYEVYLSTPDGNLSTDAYANQEKKVTLTVTNSGNTDLKNLNLTSSAPTNWEVSFDESTIDLLEAGAAKEVTATIKPNKDSITGDYVTQINVANDVVKSSIQLRVAVKTRTSWGIFAVVIIAALAAGVGCVFKKYGRR